MYGKAFAPEYQGALTTLSVNSSLVDVLAAGTEQLRAAERAGARGEAARSGLAVAEAHRRLGQVGDADRAWKASYRAAREAQDTAAMAWALWSGGTLARQRGALPLAWRLLGLAAELGERGGDIVVRGYSLAGMAETGRIQGDYAAVGALHEQLLAEARKRGEARHTVWALEGIAQMHRNTGSYDTAYAMFEEAAEIAGRADDRRGHAWALRGLADIVSVRDGDADLALGLLAEAEVTCREMNLSSALAYNHKMRGNVLYRAGRYAQARDLYELALSEFRAMSEPRGEALSRLGLAKSLARLGRDPNETATELASLATTLNQIGLRHAHRMVSQAQTELGITTEPPPRPEPGTETPARPGSDLPMTTRPGADLTVPGQRDSGTAMPAPADPRAETPAMLGPGAATPARPEPGPATPSRPGSGVAMPTQPTSGISTPDQPESGLGTPTRPGSGTATHSRPGSGAEPGPEVAGAVPDPTGTGPLPAESSGPGAGASSPLAVAASPAGQADDAGSRR